MSLDFRHQDPYRAIRKTSSQEEYYESPSLHSETFHSRAASESSTSKLQVSKEDQDPYERKKHKKKRSLQQEVYYEKRANSYLPYSNHHRDPYSTESIYLQEDKKPRGPVGSILQDNIVMDMIQHNSFYLQHDESTPHKLDAHTAIVPPGKKKKWWMRSGLGLKKIALIIFIFVVIVAIIWYFVWPRTPQLEFVDASLTNDNAANYTLTSMVASWQVNFTVINYNNWIPTHLHNLAVNVIEESTGVTFGTGYSGPLTLKGRSSSEIISVPIQINFAKDTNDQTLKTLLNACGTINQDLSSATPKQSLNVQFSIVYYITGILWHPTAIVTPQPYFQCP